MMVRFGWHINRCSAFKIDCACVRSTRIAPLAPMFILNHFCVFFLFWNCFESFLLLLFLRCPTPIIRDVRHIKMVDVVHCLHWTSFLLMYFSFVHSRVESVEVDHWVASLCGIFHCVRLRSSKCVQFDRFVFWSWCTLRANICMRVANNCTKLNYFDYLDLCCVAVARRLYCLIQIENHMRRIHFVLSVLVHCGCCCCCYYSQRQFDRMVHSRYGKISTNLFSSWSHHIVRYNWIDRETS